MILGNKPTCHLAANGLVDRSVRRDTGLTTVLTDPLNHVGHQMEEQEIWEMAAAWIEGDLDTMRSATEEETEERRTVLTVIFGNAKMRPEFM